MADLDTSTHGGAMDASNQPVLPNYGGANICGLLPHLLGSGAAPQWIPAVAREARAIVVLVIDGLGWNQLVDRLAIAPTLGAMVGGPITSVAPSTTATALTSIATGLTPAEHGVLGYRVLVSGAVMNMLRWSDDEGRRRTDIPPSEFQPVPGFLGQRVDYVTSAELVGSPFSDAHLRGGRAHGYRSPSSLPIVTSELVRQGASFVHAYYPGLDKIAHERGFGDFYDAELALVDRLVSDLIERLPSDGALVVTADHGQVHVGDDIVHPSDALLRLVERQSGEGRMRWFHARRGAESELLDAAQGEFGTRAWVRSQAQVLAEHWFGDRMPPHVVGRLGDVVVAARESMSLHDAADSGPFDLVCRHGSLTSDEMHVPLVGSVGHG